LENLVLVLDKQLKVETREATISIQFDWPNPQQAYRIVAGALQNFLEVRHVQEVTALDENIAILRGRATTLRAELAQVTEETRRGAMLAGPRPPIGKPSMASAAPERQTASEELVRLRSMLEAKQRATHDVEDFRRRRLAELMAQYESKRTVYTEDHPELVNLRRDIEALNHDSAQLIALRAEERELREKTQAMNAEEKAGPPVAAASPGEPRAAQPSAGEGTNTAVEKSERVREARRRYEDVEESVGRAQLELETARSVFKYRYQIIWPVQLPKKPVSPNPLKVFGIGGFASLVLALLAAVALDWRSGKLLERWQIERQLGLPIIGQVRLPR
jgi:uncharacterized protein involved in exopolysaccharide biosynthesis